VRPAGVALRERKKLAVRQAMGSAALRLAVERGLEAIEAERVRVHACGPVNARAG
jgi:hypothetical protein